MYTSCDNGPVKRPVQITVNFDEETCKDLFRETNVLKEK